MITRTRTKEETKNLQASSEGFRCFRCTSTKFNLLFVFEKRIQVYSEYEEEEGEQEEEKKLGKGRGGGRGSG